MTLLLCSALCYSLSDVYSKLSKNYEIIIELENRHENTKQLIFERQEHLANEFESVQKKIFDLEKSMLEDVKHIIVDRLTHRNILHIQPRERQCRTLLTVAAGCQPRWLLMLLTASHKPTFVCLAALQGSN